MDLSHLDALRARLARETARLAAAKKPNEIAFRKHEITMCEKEIAGEYRFLGIDPIEETEMSIDEILAELEA